MDRVSNEWELKDCSLKGNPNGQCERSVLRWFEHVERIIVEPEPNVRTVLVTDGEKVMSMGDQGAHGMCIPLYQVCRQICLAGIRPHNCLPVTLDVGCNNQSVLDDPYYIGLRQERVSGADYEELVDEFIEAIVCKYGQDTLIQFESMNVQNSIRLLSKYRDRYCVINADIQDIASMVLAGILASRKATGKMLGENTFCFFGAGRRFDAVPSPTKLFIDKHDAIKKKPRFLDLTWRQVCFKDLD
uniref:Malic enzyme N-terminal domain-containing protein n=1 Tax=Timema bartmani TaxID=61472 RepID=A0A7R9F3I2_9NEOP|nr:unnamed protein product [Timema bartmani]